MDTKAQNRVETGEAPHTASAGFCPLDNPLPGPVTGRRKEMEFPITDIGDDNWLLFETGIDLNSFDEPVDPARADFDIQISDTDDFDL